MFFLVFDSVPEFFKHRVYQYSLGMEFFTWILDTEEIYEWVPGVYGCWSLNTQALSIYLILIAHKMKFWLEVRNVSKFLNTNFHCCLSFFHYSETVINTYKIQFAYF